MSINPKEEKMENATVFTLTTQYDGNVVSVENITDPAEALKRYNSLSGIGNADNVAVYILTEQSGRVHKKRFKK